MDIEGRNKIYDALHSCYTENSEDYFYYNDYPIFVEPPSAYEYRDDRTDCLEDGDDVRYLTISSHINISPEMILNALSKKGLMRNSKSTSDTKPCLIPISIYSNEHERGDPDKMIHLVFEDISSSEV